MKTRYDLKIVTISFFVILFFSKLTMGQSAAQTIKTGICIVGAGSSGIGAALAASRAGCEVVLVEKAGKVGGTSTLSYVNSWEPGPGCDYAHQIYRRMSKRANATGVARQVHSYLRDEPYGISLIDTGLHYFRSLRRSDLDVKTECANVVFDVDGFDAAVREMLGETGRCRLLTNTCFTKANVRAKQVESIEAISDKGECFLITARIFIDCSGGAFLCGDAGCEVMLGEEPRSMFGEPSAPESGSKSLNAISLCYQIKPAGSSGTEAFLCQEDLNYHAVAHVTGPVGEDRKLTVNPLGIIPGELLLRESRDKVYAYGREQVDKHWAKLHTYLPFKDFEFDSYAPELGVRESYRVVCEYILTQKDLLEGLSRQTHQDMITLADHPMDIHGSNSHLKTIKEAYGVPYRCLIPQGWTNLLVAGKCAGFSHIAASSCRLSRTMMSLGHAAGFAASVAAKEGIPVYAVPAERIQAEMNLKLRQKKKLDEEPIPVNRIIGKANNGFYCCDNGNDSIYQVSKAGEIIWSYPAPGCQDIWVLPNKNILFTHHAGEKGNGGVTEVTENKQVVFNYQTEGEVHTCQRLENGNTLIGVNRTASLIEVDQQGNIRKTISLKTERRGHDAIRMVRQLKNGNYLVCQEGDNHVSEYKSNGKLFRIFKSPGKCFEAIRLDNGNTLISDGSACTVRELDKKGRVVWQITKDDFPEIKMNWLSGIKALPNGNILVSNWLGHGKAGDGIPVFEVSREKKIIFYYTDHVRTHSISNVYPVFK